MAAFFGYGGRVTVEGDVLTATHWTVNFKIDPLDITNFESGGNAEWAKGITEADATFDVV